MTTTEASRRSSGLLGAAERGERVIIAAHAAETGRLVLTGGATARFGGLPGITAIDA
jgi:hypothetical protein